MRRASRTGRALSGAALLALLGAGCAETARIQSRPAGASVEVDGRNIGVTPLTLTVPRSEWPHDFTCRVSKEGFVPETKRLTPQIGGGRVVAGLFTVGLIYLFKSPYVFGSDIYDFDLPYDTTASRAD